MFKLREGERYTYNFAGSPSGAGTFLGMTEFGFAAFERHERGRDSTEVVFLNLALLCTLTPESDPRV